ncbi:MAG: sorbosone dehydrogenase family protein [Gammaproteobacteria bacterium]|nr:sorbosone dehydrogenase family protein [Gammaproteobacteria bacterium]
MRITTLPIGLLLLFCASLALTETVSITVDEGEAVELSTYALIPSARQMALTESGILFVGSFQSRVYAIDPDNRTEPIVVAAGLPMPTGLALLDGDLYVAAHNRILKFEDIEDSYKDSPNPTVVSEDLPTESHHGWKYLSVGPENNLYFNVGAPCNICLREEEVFATIVKMDPESGEWDVYAHGVRNSVGSAWHPITEKLWFSDNGGDWLGDDIPPEEINIVDEPGSHYGYPFIHGDDYEDPTYGEQQPEDFEYVKPVVNIQAHSAALGIAFYTGNQFPDKYKNALFIAEHGSWNRSSKVGYRVSVVLFDNDEPNYKPFIDIWLDGEEVTGRPNDVLVANDGSLLISDDGAGKIYQVKYQSDN